MAYIGSKKILKVFVTEHSNETPTQEKSLNITKNGAYEITPDSDYALSKATVNVDVKKEEQEKTVTITENGTTEITPDGSKVLSKVTVTVNVSERENKLPQVIDGTVTEITADDLAGVTKIRQYAFYYHGTLERVAIPSGVTEIGKCAFYECRALNHIELPTGLKSIGNKTFSYNNLTSLIFKEGFETITGDYAIYFCEALERVDFPSTTKDLNTLCIYNCKALKKVIIRATTPPQTESSNIFVSIGEAKIYVPAESVEAYKAATNWAAYADKIFAIEE